MFPGPGVKGYAATGITPVVTNVTPVGAANGATTASADTTGANFIVVPKVYYSLATEPTLSDSKSNSYSCLPAYVLSGTQSLRICVSSVSTTVGSGHTVTCTGVGSFCAIGMMAFSGLVSATVDQETGNHGVPGTCPNTSDSGTITPSTNNQLVITAIGTSTGTGMSVAPGSFTLAGTLDFLTGTHWGVGLAYEVQTTATARQASWTITSGCSAATNDVAIATFK